MAKQEQGTGQAETGCKIYLRSRNDKYLAVRSPTLSSLWWDGAHPTDGSRIEARSTCPLMSEPRARSLPTPAPP